MKKKFEFRKNDSEKGRRFWVEVELTDENNFRACCVGPAIYWGQCIDEAGKELNIQDPLFKKIARLWQKWHLNDMCPSDEAQEEAIQEYIKTNPYDYDKVCEYLESKNLLVHNGYRYGSAWLRREIDSNDLNEIKELLA